MPHVVVKIWPGRSEEQKQRFADAVVDAAVRHLDAEPGWVSVGIEEIPEERWDAEVFQPEILGKRNTLYALCDELKETE